MSLFFITEVENKKREKGVYFLFFSLTAIIHLLFHFPPANIIINILLIYVITLLYEGGQRKKYLFHF